MHTEYEQLFVVHEPRRAQYELCQMILKHANDPDSSLFSSTETVRAKLDKYDQWAGMLQPDESLPVEAGSSQTAEKLLRLLEDCFSKLEEKMKTEVTRKALKRHRQEKAKARRDTQDHSLV